MIPGLNDLHDLVVAAGAERRTGIEPDDAAVGGTAILGPVSGMLLEISPSFLNPLLSGWRQRRHFAVRRVDNQRRAPAGDRLGSAVQPEVVVEAGRPVSAPVDVSTGSRPLGRTRIDLFITLDGLSLELGGLRLRQEFL